LSARLTRCELIDASTCSFTTWLRPQGTFTATTPPASVSDARREQLDRLRNVLEDVGEHDRVVGTATIGERLRVDVMDRRTRAGGGVGRGARIELDALRVPSGRAREMEKPPGVCADVEQAPALRSHAALEVPKDGMKNEIFAFGFEFVEYVHPIMVLHRSGAANVGSAEAGRTRSACGRPRSSVWPV
jgi:hypothetical protein